MTVDEWTDQHPDAVPLAELVRGIATFDEDVKWNRLTFTVGGDWHHWVCAVAATKKAVNLVFHKGSLLADPAGLLTGDGKYIRQIPAPRAIAAPQDVAGLVRDALAHQTDM
jgi:hypothetical protein